MKKLIFILAAIFAVSAASAYTPPDSCLVLYCNDDYDIVSNPDGSLNPDSVKVDICMDSPTYGQYYTKQYFFIKFETYPFTTAIPEYTLRSVDEIRTDIPGLKESFQEMEIQFGRLRFIRDNYYNDYPDSMYYKNGTIFLIFDNYMNIDSVLNKVKGLHNTVLLYGYNWRAAKSEDILSVPDFNKKVFPLYPSPALNVIELKVIPKTSCETIRIYSLSGEKIFESEFQSVIDVSFLQDGVYYFTYNNKAYKFIKIK